MSVLQEILTWAVVWLVISLACVLIFVHALVHALGVDAKLHGHSDPDNNEDQD